MVRLGGVVFGRLVSMVKSCLKKSIGREMGKGAVVIKVGDVVVIGEDVVSRHRWKLGIVVE